MSWLYLPAMRFPRLTLLAGLIAAVACAPGLLRIRLRTDGHALVPRNHPTIDIDERVRERFAVQDQLVIAIDTEHPDGVFNVETQGAVRDLTESLPQIDGIEAGDLTSLATERSDRVYTGSLRFRPFLDPFPVEPDDLAELRTDMQDLRLFIGALVSTDFRSTAVIVNVRPDLNRSRLIRDIRDSIARLGNLRDRVSIVGAPVAESLLGVHILEDLGALDLLGAAQGLCESWFGWRILPQLHEIELTHGSREPVQRLLRAVQRPLPLALIGIAVVIWLTCRSVLGTVLPLAEVGACLVTVFGVMGFCDVPFYLTMAVMPVILTAIGVADEIHIFARYRQALGESGSGIESGGMALRKTMDEMWRPVVKTSVTSCVGFLSFSLSPLEPVRMFGLFTALGIGVCMIWSLTVIPAWLSLINPQRFRPRKIPSAAQQAAIPAGGALSSAAGLAIRGRWAILAAAIALVCVAPQGVRKLQIQDSWIDGFAASSDFYQATERVNAGYRGTHILWLALEEEPILIRGQMPGANLQHFKALLPVEFPPEQLSRLTRCSIRPYTDDAAPYRIVNAEADALGIRIETDRRDGPMTRSRPSNLRPPYHYTVSSGPDAILDPPLIEAIGALENMLESQALVGGVLGTHDHLTTMHFMLRKRDPEFRTIPDDRPRLLKLIDYYRMVRGKQRVREILGDTHNEALVTVFLKNANFRDTHRLIQSIRDYEERELKPHHLKISLAGDVAVSQTMIPAIVKTQVFSLLISLGGILVITTVLFGSFGAGILCLLPPGLAVLCNYAVMGAAGIPLGVATSMFCGMTLGIGVDFAIHLIERCRISFARTGECGSGIRDAMSHAAPAIIIDAAAIAIGFGVLMLSQVPANNRLGLLLVLSITTCLVTTLVLLPALLTLWTPRFLRRALVQSSEDASRFRDASSSEPT